MKPLRISQIRCRSSSLFFSHTSSYFYLPLLKMLTVFVVLNTLFYNSVLGMEQDNSDSKQSVLPVKIEDHNFDDSASIIYFKKEDKKDNQDPHKESPRRILSVDGGGIRGVLPIIELCVLEEILNAPINKDNEIRRTLKKSPQDYIYISDLFDVGAGTSTGSIIVSALFFNKPNKTEESTFPKPKEKYSAIDIAKLYIRYGHKIFDHKRYGGLIGIGSKYSPEYLKELLNHHFGKLKLQDLDKEKSIYVVTLNETDQEALVYTNQTSNQASLHKHVWSAILGSSSAPYYFPAEKSFQDDKSLTLSDGGTVANNPSFLSFMMEKIIHSTNPFEIYSFGTGKVPVKGDPKADKGAIDIYKIFMNSLTASENFAYTNCVNEIQSPSSQLNYFARINPNIEKGKDEMDDASNINYHVTKALKVCKGKAFKNVVEQLKFIMPLEKEIPNIYAKIHEKLNTVKSSKYDELDQFEKDFIIETKIFTSETNIFEHDLNFLGGEIFYQQQHTDTPHQMTREEGKTFLEKANYDALVIISHSKEKKDLEKAYRQASEISLRYIEFYDLLPDSIVLEEDEFVDLTNVSNLTEEQIAYLADEKTHQSCPKSSEPSANKVCDLFDTFMYYCGKSKYDYSKENYDYIKLPSFIFWKKAFKNCKTTMTINAITSLKSKLMVFAEQIISFRHNPLIDYLATKFHPFSSRYKELVEGLDTYKDKFLTNEETKTNPSHVESKDEE